MRIERVEVFALSAPVAVPVTSAIGSFDRRNSVVVRVTTDAATGYGESWINFPPWGLRARLDTLMQGIVPWVIKERFADPPQLWRRIEPRLARLGLQCGALGELYQAYSGLDIALWDAWATSQGKPVYALLREALSGLPPSKSYPGSVRADCAGSAPAAPAPELYASGLGPPDGIRLARAHLQRGFRRFKWKVGLRPDEDLSGAQKLRELIGPDRFLMFDANQAWTAPEAVAAIERLAALAPEWIEEPVPADDIEGYRHVRARTPAPLAAGENFYGLRTWERFLREELLDVAQPDVTKCGGLSAALEIVRLAGRYGVRVVPHYLGGAVGLLATLHLAAACEPPLLVEYDANPNPLRSELIAPPLADAGGRARLRPDAAGLGAALDPNALARHRVL